LIEPNPFEDERGSFRRHFCEKEFSENGIESFIRQANVSENKSKFTLRGFHYQIGASAEGKTLSCISGSIYDIIVDVREDSPTFKKWMYFKINSKNKQSIHIPPGCANAFFTLEENCIIHYYCSQSYNSEAERGIRYNDPLFNFIWPSEPKVISKKDKNHPDFK
jgi:dTDP-4-dehydrorhamnose 3,5-epimerase